MAKKVKLDYTPNFGVYEPEELNIKTEPNDEVEESSSIEEELDIDELKTNKNKTTYACHHCVKTYFNFKNRLKHVLKFHSAKLCNLCKVCHYVVKNDEELSEHIRSAHPDTVQLVGEGKNHVKDKTNNSLDDDLNTEENDSQSCRTVFSCNFCDFRSPLIANLNYHKMTMHPFINYSCYLCYYSAQTEADVLLHISRVHKDSDFNKALDFNKDSDSNEDLDSNEGSDFNKDSPLSVVKSAKGLNDQSFDDKSNKIKTKFNEMSCPVCIFKTTNQSNLISHFAFYHGCSFCSFVAKDSVGLKAHSRVHLMQNKVKPPVIKKNKHGIVNSSNNIRKTKNKNKYFACSTCSRIFKTRQGFKNHLFKSHGLIIHSCQFCRFSSKSTKRLLKHLKSLHDFKCNLCAIKFSTKACLDNHNNFFHSSIENDLGSDDKALEMKLITHFDPFDKSNKELSFTVRLDQSFGFYFTCHLCETEFVSDIYFHIKTFHRTEYKCYSCNLSLRNLESLLNHTKKLHKESGIHTCNICGDTFSQIKMLYSHCLISHKCKLCHFISTPSMLEYHKKSHSHSQCPMCDRFFVKNFIKTHLRHHDRVQENKCHICGSIEYYWCYDHKPASLAHTCCKCKYTMNNLFEEVKDRKTTKRRDLFVCDVCGFSTSDGNSLNDHIGLNHSDFIFYKCEFCNFGAVGKTYMDLHVAERHGNSKNDTTPPTLETVTSKFLKNLISQSSSRQSLNNTIQSEITSQATPPSVIPPPSIQNVPLISVPNYQTIKNNDSNLISSYVLIYNDLDKSSSNPYFLCPILLDPKQSYTGLSRENNAIHQPSKSSKSDTVDSPVATNSEPCKPALFLQPDAFTNLPSNISVMPTTVANPPLIKSKPSRNLPSDLSVMPTPLANPPSFKSEPSTSLSSNLSVIPTPVGNPPLIKSKPSTNLPSDLSVMPTPLANPPSFKSEPSTSLPSNLSVIPTPVGNPPLIKSKLSTNLPSDLSVMPTPLANPPSFKSEPSTSLPSNLSVIPTPVGNPPLIKSKPSTNLPSDLSVMPSPLAIPLSIKSEPVEDQNEPYPEKVIIPDMIPSFDSKIDNGMKPDIQIHFSDGEEMIVPD